MIKCMKRGCGKLVTQAKSIAKQPTKKGSVHIGVCLECYEKRQKWLKSRGLA